MINWLQQQFNISPDSVLIYGDYNYWMVGVSVFIAMFSSFMGLQIASEAVNAPTLKRKRIMLLTASTALGGGIWSMHFIGMLAFDLCTPVEYGWLLTLLSALPGIAASWVALNHITSHQQNFRSLLVEGTLVGAGIGTMHYTGMAAMEMAPFLRYDLFTFLLSIVVAVTLAILALWIRFGLSRIKSHLSGWKINITAAVVMGCAISGMHYTGMAAARFVKPAGLDLSDSSADMSFYLALAVSVATIVLISSVLGINLLYKYRDITKRAVQSEHRKRALMDTSVDAIITINSDGSILSANLATKTLLGWEPELLVGQSVNVIAPSEKKWKSDDKIQRFIETKNPAIIGNGRELQVQHKNGDLIDVRLGLGHVKLEDDDFFVAFISDIRQRLKMENALRENEEKFRSMISNIPCIAYRCLHQTDWPMLFISDLVEQITGYAASEFTLPKPKRSFVDLIHPEDQHLITFNDQMDDSFNFEYRIVRKDGEIRWLMEQGNKVRDDNGRVLWLDGFILDITERHKMEQQLREAKEAAENAASVRAAFMANMSHEIRTPMNAIIGFSDILLESRLEADQAKQLRTINNSAKSLLHLLNDILDSAKLEKGKLELEIRDFSLIEEVDTVVSTLWLQARNNGLKLTTNISPKLKACYQGSPERIRQVLTNLLSNAVKFTQQGFVELNVEPETANQVKFSVIDSGIGMSEEQLANVFEPFTQADASMSRRFGGTGLGTTICKQLVDLMGGTISAKSELGKGSEFTVILPLEEGQQQTSELAIESVQLPPLKILIVDDIQQNIDLLTLLFSRHGHEVVTARDGQQALIRMTTEDNLDLVLMDVQMPVMDGLTAARERRIQEQQTQNLKPLPIIALTASVLEDDKVAAQNAGMDGFANKPVDFDILSAEIARVLGIGKRTSGTSQQRQPSKLIDESKGVALWGNKSAYFSELRNFTLQHQTDFEQLIVTCAAQNWPLLKADVHKLKGLSGNLSLTQLMRHLEKVESVILSHPEQSCKLLPDTLEIFTRVKEQVAAYVNSADTTAVTLSEQKIPNQNLVELLEDIYRQATENEIDEANLERLLSIQHSEYSSEFQNIYQALNDFEFDSAQQQLLQLINKVKHQD
ncbi:MHYT domain-containing protein [Neptunicella marina]|uniref:histidine kinase n=1 Tax=Neptunicella marina TaxID=2125989 RepID=A0A8J6M082_9ALTE|nr:MHYT domain-containing protein [Neptunicella marina]MBC3766955.1 PAS domain S-box protein [Neptunicella marina]